MFRIGEARYLENDATGASEVLERFLETYPNDELVAYALPYLGDLALSIRDFETATQHYSAGMARFPQGPLFDECRYGLARALQERGELGAAREIFRELAADSEHRLSTNAQFQLAAIDYSQGKYETAEQTLTEFLARWPQSPQRDKAVLARAGPNSNSSVTTRPEPRSTHC